MKHFFRILTIFISCTISTPHIFAKNETQLIPIDSAIRYGKLENGMTYYIRHNEFPKNKAVFFFAQRTGSMQENDHQTGFSVLLERLFFKGSKNFSENTMVDYLKNLGVRSGENMNIFTGFDETVAYISKVPVVREGIIDSCLLILHDWSACLDLNTTTVEDERDSILKGIQSDKPGRFSSIEQLLPQVMPRSLYSKRIPDKDMNALVSDFNQSSLKNFYQKYYRPDLQGIIIVGDIDTKWVEEKIKQTFSDIPRATEPVERVYYPVEDNKTPLIGIVKDNNVYRTTVTVYYKYDSESRQQKVSMEGLRTAYIEDVIDRMFNHRLWEMAKNEETPFAYAGGFDGDFIVAKTQKALGFYGESKEGKEEETFKALVREAERAKRFGFTPYEFDLARKSLLEYYDDISKEREKDYSDRYADEYVEHFLNAGPIPGTRFEFLNTIKLINSVPQKIIHDYYSKIIGDKNVVITFRYPNNEAFEIPSQSQIIKWFDEVRKEDLKKTSEK